MVLLDTNIVIDGFRQQDIELVRQITDTPSYVCGVVRAETLNGESDALRRTEIVAYLDQFLQIPTPETVWDRVGLNLTKLRKRGLSIPFNDVLIATIAVQYQIPVWTNDKQFDLMQTVLPDLKLFKTTTP